MSNSVKVAFYTVLVLLAGVSGYFALSSFRQLMNRSSERGSDLEQIEPERKTPAEETPGTNAAANAPTNAANSAAITAVSTNASGSNAVAASGSSTNANAAGTNAQQAAPEPPAPTALAVPAAAKLQPHKPGSTRIGLWSALFVISLIGIGLLVANDISHYLGNRALKTLYNDDGEGTKDPEYEQAEQVWANGNHLEAIGMMREYLKKNPREQHVAIRIAEIYEKDLKNYLAAALEYEEVLKHKLPGERWGWAAIHLCNLYFKLSQETKAYDLLRRIVNEYPATAAAEKARKRLEQVEGTPSGQALTESQVTTAPGAPGPAVAATTPASNLPPGFRPKK
jgi:tetratricopeptide (TPR) repeat protein